MAAAAAASAVAAAPAHTTHSPRPFGSAKAEFYRLKHVALQVCAECQGHIADLRDTDVFECPGRHTAQLMFCCTACYTQHIARTHNNAHPSFAASERRKYGTMPLGQASLFAHVCRKCIADGIPFQVTTHYLRQHMQLVHDTATCDQCQRDYPFFAATYDTQSCGRAACTSGNSERRMLFCSDACKAQHISESHDFFASVAHEPTRASDSHVFSSSWSSSAVAATGATTAATTTTSATSATSEITATPVTAATTTTATATSAAATTASVVMPTTMSHRMSTRSPSKRRMPSRFLS